LGAKVIDADRIAHRALRKNSPLFKKIVALFPEALNARGQFCRDRIAARVFSDPRKRKRLEALIHPYVFREIQRKTKTFGKKVVIVEVPLLFEAGFESLCDKVIAVVCDRPVKMARLGAKGYSPASVKARERAQMKESLKAQKADFVIDNSGSVSKTGRSVERLWERFGRLLKGE